MVVMLVLMAACSPPRFLRDLTKGSRGAGETQQFPAPDPPPESSELFLGIIQETYSLGWDTVLDNAHQPGSLILDVVPGTPAEELGIERGSILVQVDDVAIRNSAQVRVLFTVSDEENHSLRIVRPDGESEDIEATLRPAPPVDDLLEPRRRRIEETGDPVSKFLTAQGSSDEAEWIKLLDELIVEYPDFAPAYELKAVKIAESLAAEPEEFAEREQAARDLIATAAELDPDSAGLYASSASISYHLNDMQAAEDDAARAVELDETLAEARNLLGIAQLALERPNEAISNLHKAVALNPYEIDFYFELALCYRVLGQEDSAGKTIESAKTLTDDPAVQGALDAVLEQPLTREGSG